MNAIDFLVLAILLIALIAAVLHIVRAKRKRRFGACSHCIGADFCGGSCHACSNRQKSKE